jgi:hypothetical protein
MGSLRVACASFFFGRNIENHKLWIDVNTTQLTQNVLITRIIPRNFPKPAALSSCKGEGTPRKLVSATQPQFPRNFSDFKQAISLQIRRRTQRKLIFVLLLTSS